MIILLSKNVPSKLHTRAISYVLIAGSYNCSLIKTPLDALDQGWQTSFDFDQKTS